MKLALLGGIVLISTATIQPQPPVSAPQTTTLTGCVSGGSKAQPITLMNALVLPAGAATPAPDTAQPAPDAAVPPAATAPGSAGEAAASVQGTAPAGSSPSSVGGYRLSGTDMTAWLGRRVQIVGVLVSSPTASSVKPTGTSGVPHKTEPLPVPEFRVMSVQPITGACPAK